MSKFDQIDTFVSIVNAGSLAEAARTLKLSAAAVGKQLKQLETRLGVQLLQRSTRKIMLTEAGKLFFQQCLMILEELHEAEALLEQLHREPTGTLRVAATVYFGEHCIAPHLAEFLEKYPKIQLELKIADEFPNFFQQKLDILFIIEWPGTQALNDLTYQPICPTRFVLCASPDYLKRHGTPHTIQQLKQHRFINHSNRKPENVVYLKKRKPATITPALYFNTTTASAQAAVQGLGIVLLDQLEASTYLAKGQLVEVLAQEMESELFIAAYYQSRRYVQPKIRLFVEFMQKKMQAKK